MKYTRWEHYKKSGNEIWKFYRKNKICIQFVYNPLNLRKYYFVHLVQLSNHYRNYAAQANAKNAQIAFAGHKYLVFKNQ